MPWRIAPININISSRNKTLLPVALVAGAAVAGLGVMLYQISKVLFNIVRECDYEARKLVQEVTVAMTADYGDVVVPEDMDVIWEDDAGTIYSYGVLQVLYFRRGHEGATDWEWSYDQVDWWPTSELAPDANAPLDPPNLIFLCRLHLASVARRKSSGQPPIEQQQRIPPPLDFSSSTRDLTDAPDALCCPITGQIMVQPVCSPSGKTYEYATVKDWISRHGTDPNTSQPMSLLQLYPNLVLRELIEAWAAGEVELAEVESQATTTGRAQAAGASNRGCQDSSAATAGASAFANGPVNGFRRGSDDMLQQQQRGVGLPTSNGTNPSSVTGHGDQEGLAAVDRSIARRGSKQWGGKGD